MITRKQAEDIFEKLAHKTTYKELSKIYGYHPSTLCKYMKTFKSEFGMKPQEVFSAKTFLRYKYKEEIVNRYLQGESSEKIIQDFGFSDGNIIITILRELNIPIRSRGYVSKTNQFLFKDIKTEIEAYTLGLITADGNIGTNYMISIHLTESDQYLLEKINKNLFDNSGHILVSNKEKGKPVSRLSICGKQICENLAQYNVIPNKSEFLNKIYRFDEPLMKHYLRGLFDGDGVCAKNDKYLRIGFCAKNKNFCQDFQDYLSNRIQLKQNALFNTGGCWHCSWGSKADIQKIYNYLYNDATIFLTRKKDKILNYLQGNSEVIN